MFEREHDRVVRGGADLRDADALAFQVFRLFNPRRARENVIHLVDHAADEDEIRAAGAGADDRLAGERHDRQIAGDERLRAARAALDENHVGVEGEALEEAFVSRHPQRGLIGAERGVAEQKAPRLAVRRGTRRENSRPKRDGEKTNRARRERIAQYHHRRSLRAQSMPRERSSQPRC
jgi:hypothetical protein